MVLRLQDEPSWEQFLKDAGIPATEAAAYTAIFLKERINETTLPDLTAEHLRTLQITVLGDVLSILKHAKTLRPSTNVQATVSSELDHTAYRPPTTAAKLPEITSPK